MSEPAELLMLTSVVHRCADCEDDRVFIAVETEALYEFACTDCGAAVVIDPAFGAESARSHRNVA